MNLKEMMLQGNLQKRYSPLPTLAKPIDLIIEVA